MNKNKLEVLEYSFNNDLTYEILSHNQFINHDNPELLIITTDERLPKMNLE